jgi:outer membrane protein assembly factor BamD
MSAYAYYQGEQYTDCVNSAKRYVTLHPGSPDAAYAQYLIGASYYDQILDVSRDQDRANQAIDALQEVVRKYPTSEYAVSAKKKIDMARDQLAGKEMDVGRFYIKRRDFVGAINRFKVVVTQYQTTRHVEEALMRLSEAYVSLGIMDEAQTAAAVLGHNFPDSPWYKDSYDLVKNAGGEPTTENKGSWISRAFQKIGLVGSQSTG